jgi:putative redox protein
MTSKITYQGDLRCESEHVQSGTMVITDAPTDNHGKGDAFSPTDLCAASLAQCMLTTIAILGKEKGILIDGSYAEIQKNMTSTPRKIAEIVCDI